jgi:uncharacterized protein
MRKIGLIFFAAGLVIGLLSWQNSLCICQEVSYPAPRGYVNDFAGIVSEDSSQAIEALCRRIESKTTAQVALAIVPTTKPLEIEEYAVNLFEKWGIGLKGKDNGILVLVAVQDRAVRIETGYGMEGAVTDAEASAIINQIILPEFKSGNYANGLMLAVLSLAKKISEEYNVDLELDNLSSGDYGKKQGHSAFGTLIYLLFFIIVFGMRSGLLFFLILGPTGRRRGGYWYGSGFGGSGGGFGGFGNGFSGGGGATGRW